MIVENQPVIFAKQSVVYNSVKNKAKIVLKERKDKEINTENLYQFTIYQELHPVLINHWESLSNQKPWLHTTHQSGDLETFLNTHHLWKKTPQVRTTFESAHQQFSQKYSSQEREQWVHLDTIRLKQRWIQYNPIPLL